MFPREDDPGFVFFYDHHADSVNGVIDSFVARTGQEANTYVQRFSRACAQDVDGAPCGAVATHVAMFGVKVGKPTVVVESICRRHVEERAGR